MPEEAQATAAKQISIESAVQNVLNTIERVREREIIARRFGLFDRRETLEQIGELLGITRERVRQLEKAVIARLKTTAAAGKLPHIQEIEKTLLAQLRAMGNAARVSDLASSVTTENSRTDQSRITFLAQLC